MRLEGSKLISARDLTRSIARERLPQIVDRLGMVDRLSIYVIVRGFGIATGTVERWRGGAEMRRLRKLEEENNCLKPIVDNLSLDKEMLQDIVRRKI